MTKTTGIPFDFVFMTIFAFMYPFHTSFKEFSTSTISFSHFLLNFLVRNQEQPSEKTLSGQEDIQISRYPSLYNGA